MPTNKVQFDYAKFPAGPSASIQLSAFEDATVNDYDNIAAVFDEIMGFDFLQASYGRKHARIAAHFGGNPFRSLDLCCGTGLFLERLAEDFETTAFGVDLSERQIHIARNRLAGTHHVTLMTGDITTTRFPSDIDLVTMNMDAINHLTNPKLWETVFQKTAAALSPGGLFIFDMNLRRRLADDWNEIESIDTKNTSYVQYALEPTRTDKLIWRKTPMLVFKRHADTTLFSRHRALIEHMSMPLTSVLKIANRYGLSGEVEAIGNAPSDHIFNKHRAYFYLTKKLG